MNPPKKEFDIKLTPGLHPPMFADAITLAVTVRQSKDGKDKAGHLRLTFLDSQKHQILSEIVIDHMHAREFSKVLGENIKALDGAMRKGKIPKKKIKGEIVLSPEDKARYIN